MKKTIRNNKKVIEELKFENSSLKLQLSKMQKVDSDGKKIWRNKRKKSFNSSSSSEELSDDAKFKEKSKQSISSQSMEEPTSTPSAIKNEANKKINKLDKSKSQFKILKPQDILK